MPVSTVQKRLQDLLAQEPHQVDKMQRRKSPLSHSPGKPTGTTASERL